MSWELSAINTTLLAVAWSQFFQLGLSQFINFATHLANDGSLGSLLDLALLSDVSVLHRVSSLPPFGKSDHVECVLSVQVAGSSVPCPRRQLYMYDKADFEKINKSLSQLDWSKVSTARDVDQAWEAWRELFMSVITKEVLSMIVSGVRHTLPWLDSKLKDMIKQKRATWKAFKRFRSVYYLSAFRAIRNKACSALLTAEKQYLLSLHRDIRTVNRSDSVNTSWSYIKRVTGRIKASTIPDLVTHPQDSSSDTVITDAG